MMIVVKTGGSILKNGIPKELLLDLKKISQKDRIVLVHGGGAEVTEIASKLGKEQEFILSPEGFRSRYTDRETIEIYTMVMAGRINKQIVTALQAIGVPAIGISGLDGLLAKAKRKKSLIAIDERGRRRVVDGGFTGSISEIDTKLLQILLDNGYVPVVAPIAMSEEFEPLNVDGDRMAARIAGALHAEKLVLLTDVESLTLDGKPVSKLTLEEAKDALQKIGYGMITKIHAASEALEAGIDQVLIGSGLKEAPLSSCLEHLTGTVITRE